MGKKICVLFIDWEAQFSCTINYVQSLRELYTDVIEEFYWVALPLTTQNSLSQYQPEWQCWEPDVEWVRQPPQDAITDPDFFSFYQPGMTFEQFVREFAEWFSQKRPAAMMIGIRADESYNRFVAIASLNKQRFADDKPWTTAAPGGHSWYIYPIYDWKVADIWTWYANHQSLCNPLYNLMYQAGVSSASYANLRTFWPGATTRIMALSRYRTGSLGCYVRTSQRGKKWRHLRRT